MSRFLDAPELMSEQLSLCPSATVRQSHVKKTSGMKKIVSWEKLENARIARNVHALIGKKPSKTMFYKLPVARICLVKVQLCFFYTMSNS